MSVQLSFEDVEEPDEDDVARSFGYDEAKELREADQDEAEEDVVDLDRLVEESEYDELRRLALIVGVRANQAPSELRDKIEERREVLEERLEMREMEV